MMKPTAHLVMTCPDRPGIVATVTGFLHNHGVNVVHLDQHTTPRPRRGDEGESGTFFMRIAFTAEDFRVLRPAMEPAFEAVVARRFAMAWRMSWPEARQRVAILVSKHDHTMMELLWRWRRGELPCDITQVISNHPDHEGAVASFGIPWRLIPVSRETKQEAESQLLEALGDGTDLVVLARYMQILSPRVVEAFSNRIINIHHSFLPAFVGARPYHQAWARGVKRIGATAHYVTEELDEGPIIEQDAISVSHRHTPEDLVALGRDIERQVLARAVKWHLEDRVIVHDGKTVVFA